MTFKAVSGPIGLAFVAWLWCSPAALADANADVMRLHFIDVGQGAATLVEFPCAAILIDTGGEQDKALGYDSTAMLITYLDNFFSQRPDLNRTLALLALTHPHIDHTRGVSSVLSHYSVMNVIDDGWNRGSASGLSEQKDAEAAAANADGPKYEAITLGDLAGNAGKTDSSIDPVSCPTRSPKIEVLWGLVPDRPNSWTAAQFADPNNNSVVFRIDYGKASALITGDLRDAAIHDLVQKYKNTSQLKVDIYEVGHHGSANGTTPELLQAMSPKIAVMEVGSPDRQVDWTAWAYGHPRKDIVDMLLASVTESRPAKTVKVATGVKTFVDETVDKAVYATGWDGNIVIEAGPDGAYSLKTDK